ncbi:MAG: hypothetical protein RLZ97_2454 [Verrucomicrobiota bacterium]
MGVGDEGERLGIPGVQPQSRLGEVDATVEFDGDQAGGVKRVERIFVGGGGFGKPDSENPAGAATGNKGIVSTGPGVARGRDPASFRP